MPLGEWRENDCKCISSLVFFDIFAQMRFALVHSFTITSLFLSLNWFGLVLCANFNETMTITIDVLLVFPALISLPSLRWDFMCCVSSLVERFC